MKRGADGACSRVRTQRDEGMDEAQMTIGQALVAALRRMGTFTTGDQLKLCAILWTDPQRLWGNALSEIKALLPELFEFGSYHAEHRGRQSGGVALRRGRSTPD